MTEEYWDQGNDVVESEMSGRGTYIIVNGSRRTLNPGDSFKDSVRANAIDAGLGKFRVFYNGDEIKPSMAPDTISEGDKIELRPYDVAGK